MSSSALKILLYSNNFTFVSTLFMRFCMRFIAISSLVPATRNSLFNIVAAILEQRLLKKKSWNGFLKSFYCSIVSGKFYLETKRTVQAMSCKDSIRRMMLRISGGKLSKVFRILLYPRASCLYRENTLRRFAPIWFLSDSNLSLKSRIAINYNRSRSITKITYVLA